MVARIDPNDMIGQEVGTLTVLECLGRVPVGRTAHTYNYRCSCVCGNVVVLSRVHLQQYVKSCGCVRRRQGADSPLWVGHGDISGHFWTRILRHAKDRDLEIQVSIQDVWGVYIAQDRKCALTGIPIVMPTRSKVENVASLDRIDNTKGYVKGNVQWVHKHVNQMKGTRSQDDFVYWCRSVARFDETFPTRLADQKKAVQALAAAENAVDQ